MSFGFLHEKKALRGAVGGTGSHGSPTDALGMDINQERLSLQMWQQHFLLIKTQSPSEG